MLCWFLPGATQAKAGDRGRAEPRLSWLPVQHPARRAGWYSCPALQKETVKSVAVATFRVVTVAGTNITYAIKKKKAFAKIRA